jgi:16S rRNA (adenine1518-N6/adenine1519-N6)-dimethyltransferase
LPVTNIPELDPESLIKRYGFRVNKRMGQNFLQDKNELEFIASAAKISSTDTVLEIGPGLGSLTRYLSNDAREVIAIELDEKLDKLLSSVLKPFPNVHLIYGDILDFSAKDLGLDPNYIVAANIPYNITSSIIRHLLESDPQPRRIVLTIQEEVAERLCQKPPDMSLLALSVQVYGEPSILKRIPSKAFYPEPHVDSAVVRIEIYPVPIINSSYLPLFFKLAKAGFGQKRKTLRNALSAGLSISPKDVESLFKLAQLDPQRRAETLSIQEWNVLTELWINHKS